MIRGFKFGIGLFTGFFLTAAFAFVVSGTVKTWTTGETLTAADLNATVQSLKTAIESASQVGVSSTLGVLFPSTTSYNHLLASCSSASDCSLTMNRAGTVKNSVLKITLNTANVACTITLIKNLTDTAISFNLPAGSTTTISDADTVSFVATDTLGWRVTCPGLGSGGVGSFASFEF